MDLLQTVPTGVTQEIREAEPIPPHTLLISSMTDDAVILVHNHLHEDVSKCIGDGSTWGYIYMRKPCLMLMAALDVTFISLL